MLRARTLGSFLVTLLAAIPLVSCGNPGDVGHPQAQMAGTTPVTVTIPPGAMGMGPQAFGINPLVVPQGTMVIWQNGDTIAHTATSDTGVWDTGPIQPGANANFTFNDAGTFPYHCSIHGAASMSGVIEVTPSPGASPSPAVTPSQTPSPIPSPSPTVSPSATPTATPTNPSQQQQQQQKPITTSGTGTTGY